MFVSQDVVFEEGQPNHTSVSVGEQIPVLDTNTLLNSPVNTLLTPSANNGSIPASNVPDLPHVPDLIDVAINNPIPELHPSN